MPIYEYVCAKCRQEFEALVRGEEKPECPECGGDQSEQADRVFRPRTAGRG